MGCGTAEVVQFFWSDGRFEHLHRVERGARCVPRMRPLPLRTSDVSDDVTEELSELTPRKTSPLFSPLLLEPLIVSCTMQVAAAGVASQLSTKALCRPIAHGPRHTAQ